MSETDHRVIQIVFAPSLYSPSLERPLLSNLLESSINVDPHPSLRVGESGVIPDGIRCDRITLYRL